MDDADYVDTLLIDNLVPHHKEEPSFDLLVKIDENNILGIISALLLIQKPALMYVLGFWMSTVRIPA